MSRVSPLAAPLAPSPVDGVPPATPTAGLALAPDTIASGRTAAPDRLAAAAARHNDPLGPDVHGTPYDAAINHAARANNLPPTLLASLIESESSYNPYSLSPTGAQGLTQLEPGTAAELGVTNAWDPTQNIDGGARYLRAMLDQSNGDVTTALEKYNAGPNSHHLAGSYGYAAGIEQRQARFAAAAGNVHVDLAERLPTLREGTGSENAQAVRAVQERLGITADGAFGPNTQAAVQHFQTAHGLDPDGVVGSATWRALGLAAAPNASAPHASTPPSGPGGAPTNATQTPHPTLREDSRGNAVAQVQRAVGTRADGIFGPKTLAAVQRYQSAHGLTPDGVVGAKTWAALDGARATPAAASKPATATKPAAPAPPAIPSTGPLLRAGARGADVTTLQHALGIPADGTFGATTKAAVMAFQADHGLHVDGDVGPKTRAALAADPSAHASLAPKGGHYSRLAVVQQLANTPNSTTDSTQLTDLANPATTTRRTTDMLGWMFAHGSPAITLTAVNSDHHDDGPNLHSGGAAIDFVPQDDARASRIVQLLDQNPYVTNVGLSGTYDTRANDAAIANPNIIGFHDGGTGPHIHVGTSPNAGDSISRRGRF